MLSTCVRTVLGLSARLRATSLLLSPKLILAKTSISRSVNTVAAFVGGFNGCPFAAARRASTMMGSKFTCSASSRSSVVASYLLNGARHGLDEHNAFQAAAVAGVR
jgi:hypothetical protein